MAPGPTFAATSGLPPRGDLAGRRRDLAALSTAPAGATGTGCAADDGLGGTGRTAPATVRAGGVVKHDGNGWVICHRQHRHWGRFGAAGLLLNADAAVLLQHRAAWTHEGDTWSLPGGARDSHEDAVAAALRETGEETDFDVTALDVRTTWTDDHGGWSYTTVIATTGSPVSVAPANAESVQLSWWPIDTVAGLPLHSGFAAAWPQLVPLLVA